MGLTLGPFCNSRMQIARDNESGGGGEDLLVGVFLAKFSGLQEWAAEMRLVLGECQGW